MFPTSQDLPMDIEAPLMGDGVSVRQSHSGSRLATETGCVALPPVAILLMSFFLHSKRRFGQSQTVSSAGLPSGGGHGPTPAHDDPGTGAHAPESGVTTPPAPARRSAETEKKSESGDRKAFRHPRTKH